MSNDDDPFGRRDRTIIVPNPGGRRPTPTAPGAPTLPPPSPGYPPPSSASTYPPASFTPPQSYPQRDEWGGVASPPPVNPYLQTGAVSEPMTPAPRTPHVSVDLVDVTASPLLRASASLLLLLGRLSSSLSRAGAGQLMDQVAQAIQQFELKARADGVPAEQVTVAKYALAATADDIVQNLPSEERAVWTRYSMLARFFGERIGGVKFFQELDRAKQQPTINLGLLELMHACLSLGFEGMYRATGGVGQLQAVRRDLYETIRRAAAKSIEELSPHWRGQTIALAGSRFQVPVWTVAAAAAALLFAVYLVLRNLLSNGAEALALKMAQIHPDTEVQIARAAPVPPPPKPKPHISTQLERIRAVLANEIMQGLVDADENATSIFIRIGNVVLFSKGGANVNGSFTPIAKKIVASLDKEPGEIRVDGYTDSDPIPRGTLAFASNYELSLARAKNVAGFLKPDLTQPDRLVVSGKGPDNPVALNDVESNKAKNRRVEISIPRAD
jgi:type VI secretion system protein ImpK